MSSSTESPPTSQQSHAHHRSARRKLSSNFTTMQFCSLPTPIAEGDAPALSSNHLSSRQSRDGSPEGSVDGDFVSGDRLQQSTSSDNVFMEAEGTSLTFHPLYPSNRRGSIHSETFHSSSAVNVSPQVSKLRPHRPNPLISHTNGSRARSQSAVFAGREDPYSLLSNGSPLSRRATLALVSRSHLPVGSHAGPSLSPLTSGHKSRTPSGNDTSHFPASTLYNYANKGKRVQG